MKTFLDSLEERFGGLRYSPTQSQAGSPTESPSQLANSPRRTATQLATQLATQPQPTAQAQDGPSLVVTHKQMQFAPQQPLILSGATPCPVCQGTWEIETYGPDGNTRCYTCRVVRDGTQWVEPMLIAETVEAGSMTDPALPTDHGTAHPLVDEARSMIKWVRPKPSEIATASETNANATASPPRSIAAILSLFDGI